MIFTDPYYDAKFNKFTPALYKLVHQLRQDGNVLAAAAKAKALFCNHREALLHGDLHTGSCMVTEQSYFVIDTEFAFYGPMAFDVGKLIANVLLSFFALDGHSTPQEPRGKQRAHLLKVRYLHPLHVQLQVMSCSTSSLLPCCHLGGHVERKHNV